MKRKGSSVFELCFWEDGVVIGWRRLSRARQNIRQASHKTDGRTQCDIARMLFWFTVKR